MDINEAFPSNYLKAADFKGNARKLTMQGCRFEDVGGEQKLVLYFAETDRGLVLNKTNANTIASMFGPDTDGWHNQTIELWPTLVDFQGRQVDAIRVRASTAAGPVQQQPIAPPPQEDQPF